MRAKPDIYDIILWGLYLGLAVMFIIASYFAVRIYVVDQFIIPTDSMQPTLIPGDRVIVNKLIAGARIYDEFDFSEGTPMKSHRTKGFRKVRHNDIVIFNYPLSRNKKRIEFELNYVYGKRCVGLPGDTISIVDGYYKNSNYEGDIGDINQQKIMSEIPDSSMPKRGFKPSRFKGFTIKDFGPLYIPRQGDKISLDQTAVKRYRLLIEFETGMTLGGNGDSSFNLGDAQISEYTFTKNYYFMCGDNVMNSSDSRYWGFVPEEFIVGVVSRITYSRDRETNEFRWDRLMKSVMKR